MRRILAALLVCLAAISNAAAGEAGNLTGTWKLKSMVTEFQVSGEKRHLFGSRPLGYVIFTPQGRFMAVITAEGRKSAQTSDERAALLETLFAYSGMYRVEADRFITRVDVSWNEVWTGTDQVRYFKLDGDRLDIISAWAPSGVIPEKPVVRGILSFERDKAR